MILKFKKYIISYINKLFKKQSKNPTLDINDPIYDVFRMINRKNDKLLFDEMRRSLKENEHLISIHGNLTKIKERDDAR